MKRTNITSPAPPRPFAGVPGVYYPAQNAQPMRSTLPKGCPRMVASLAKLAPWIQAAGLWATVPCRSTLMKWKSYGLIVYRSGATGVQLIDVPATLNLLTPKK